MSVGQILHIVRGLRLFFGPFDDVFTDQQKVGSIPRPLVYSMGLAGWLFKYPVGLAGTPFGEVTVPDFAREPLSLSGVILQPIPPPVSAPQDGVAGIIPSYLLRAAPARGPTASKGTSKSSRAVPD